MDDTEEDVDALHRLGLATNEAKVLLGLQGLGSGTAREISDVADVPRSQVYAAADGLETQGLVQVQHANPKEYQALGAAEAVAVLRSRFERDLDRVQRTLERRERSQGQTGEVREEIWVVRGRESVDSRVEELIDTAEERVMLGIPDVEFLTDGIESALERRARDGLDVVVISSDAAVADEFPTGPVTVVEPPADLHEDENTSRILLIDDDGVLHSVFGKGALPGPERETAFWSRESGFAEVFVSLVDASLEGTDR